MATRVTHLVPASICSGLMNPGFELIILFAIMEFAPGAEMAWQEPSRSRDSSERGIAGSGRRRSRRIEGEDRCR